MSARQRFVGLLLLHGLLLGIFGHLTTPRILEPLMSVPPNRYFSPSEAMMLLSAFGFACNSTGWLFLLGGLAAALLVWNGRRERLRKALSAILVCASIGLLACIVYAESIPSWVEDQHGPNARQRMFGRTTLR